MIYRYYLILIYIFKLVTLTSNVDNLKKKLEEANATSQAAKSAMDKKIAENFDIEEICRRLTQFFLLKAD